MTIELESDGKISLPVNYNYLLQAFIYNNIPQYLADFLHKKGYAGGKRRFKLFTFSRLFGKYRIIQNKIEFDTKAKFVFSTPVDAIIRGFANTLVNSGKYEMHGTKLFVSSIRVHPAPSISGNMVIRFLSPVTIYSTLRTATNQKKTYYYSPFENEFSELVEENMKKKYIAYWNSEPKGESLKIAPLKHLQEKILNYKGTIIKAWLGIFKLSGTEKLLKLAYDTGLGGKNSQGFGCFERINPK